MSITHRVKRLLGISMVGAMVLALMPAGFAAASEHTIQADEVEACEGSEGLVEFNDNLGFFESEIECMAAFGITVGDTDGNFNTTATTTRQQMALFIARFIAQAETGTTDIPESTDDAFDDIADINPEEARDAINWLADLEVTTGVTADTYDPSGSVTRQQMASFIARAHVYLEVDLPDPADEDVFTDTDDISDVHKENVLILQAAGVVEGTADGSYSPHAAVTRGQMSAFIVRSIGVLEAQGLWNGVFVVEPPVSSGLNVELEVSSPFVGASVEATVTYLDDDLDPVAGARVEWAIFEDEVVLDADGDIDTGSGDFVAGSGEITAGSPQTDTDGVVEFEYDTTGDDAGNYVIAFWAGAIGTSNPDDADAVAFAEYSIADGPTALSLESTVTTTGVLPYGTDEVLEVTITDGTNPLAIAGAEIELQIERTINGVGPDTLANRYANTDADGVATFTLASPPVPADPSDDTVYEYVVNADLDGDGVFDDLTEDPAGSTTWTSADAGTVDADVSTFSIPSNSNVDDQYSTLIETSVTTTATVLDIFGDPVAGVAVEFDVGGTTFDRTTNASGVATLVYTGPAAAGSDAISVQVDDSDDGTADAAITTVNTNAAATVYWVEAAEDEDTGDASSVLLGFNTSANYVDVVVNNVGDANVRVPYDSDDQFSVGGSPVTMAAFETALEDDSDATSTVEFTYNEDGVSSFDLTP